MWVKLLGLLCAGVFVGAALLEAKKFRRRDKEDDEDDKPRAEEPGER